MNVKALLRNYIFHCTKINVWHKKGSMYCYIRSLFYIRQQRVYYLSARRFLEELAFREKRIRIHICYFVAFFISELWDIVNLCTTEPHVPMELNHTQILNRLSNKLHTKSDLEPFVKCYWHTIFCCRRTCCKTLSFSQQNWQPLDAEQCERRGSQRMLSQERPSGNLLCSEGWSGYEDRLKTQEHKDTNYQLVHYYSMTTVHIYKTWIYEHCLV